MLNCKNVVHLASDYLDKSMTGVLPWKVRLHLLACNSCRRFVKHLKITKEVAPQLIHLHLSEADAAAVLHRIKVQP